MREREREIVSTTIITENRPSHYALFGGNNLNAIIKLDLHKTPH